MLIPPKTMPRGQPTPRLQRDLPVALRHPIPEIAKISARAAWAGSVWLLFRIRVACHESFRAAVCRVYEDDVRWLTPWRIDGQEYDRVLEQLRHRMDGTAL